MRLNPPRNKKNRRHKKQRGQREGGEEEEVEIGTSVKKNPIVYKLAQG